MGSGAASFSGSGSGSGSFSRWFRVALVFFWLPLTLAVFDFVSSSEGERVLRREGFEREEGEGELVLCLLAACLFLSTC